MAYNVISCKKIKRNDKKKQNCWFYYKNSAPELRNDQKSPNVQAVHNMCGKGGKGGRGCFRVNYRRLNLTKKCICGVTELKKNMGKKYKVGKFYS